MGSQAGSPPVHNGLEPGGGKSGWVSPVHDRLEPGGGESGSVSPMHDGLEPGGGKSGRVSPGHHGQLQPPLRLSVCVSRRLESGLQPGAKPGTLGSSSLSQVTLNK